MSDTTVSTHDQRSPARIGFLPSGRTVVSENGHSLLDVAREAHVWIEQTCNGEGTCGKCRVKVSGHASPLTTQERKLLSREQVEEGFRLACQVVPYGTLEASVPEMGPLNLLSEGLRFHARLQPQIRKRCLQLPPPTLHDARDDLSRVLAALGKHRMPADLRLLQSLPATLREGEWRVTAVSDGMELIAVEPGDTRTALFGVAFDIGTTTVVGYLRDLNDGRLRATAATANPQAAYGADVIARIEHTTGSSGGSQELRKAITRCLNHLIGELCEAAGIAASDIYEVVAAGNTTMLHLLLGLPVASIAQAPFVPAVGAGLTLDAANVWLKIHPRGRVYLLPHIASYVGADIVADLLAAHFCGRRDLTLLLDLGTNAEIVLGNQFQVLACSAAAGPCFEGGNISCGMRASRGAISGAYLEGDELVLETVGDAPPAGVCGSGLLDLVALLRRYGVVSEAGRLLDAAKAPDAPEGLRRRVEAGDRGNRFLLASGDESAEGISLYLTQRDIRQLQAAKAAIAAGVRLLCRQWGAEPGQIHEVLLAGAFGNFIRTQSGRDIGLLPGNHATVYHSVGNAAGVGAQIALLNAPSRRKLDRLAALVEYVELSAAPEFTDIYAEEMAFPSVSSDPTASVPPSSAIS